MSTWTELELLRMELANVEGAYAPAKANARQHQELAHRYARDQESHAGRIETLQRRIEIETQKDIDAALVGGAP